MPKMFQVYGLGQALIPVLPPPIPFENAPNSNQTNFEIGQLVYTKSPVAFYLYAGGGTWIEISDADGPIQNVLGTTNQITASVVDGVVTLSLPTGLVAPGSLTATLGNITATNGNFVKGTAGNKDVYTSLATTTAAGANSAGTVTLVGGTATISTTAVTANSKIRLYRQGVGATGAAAVGNLSIGTITAGTSFVINSVLTANATALATTDVSVVFWEIVN